MAFKKRRTVRSKKPTVTVTGTGESPPVGPVSEFRSGDGDAWHSVNLVLQGETLIVKYREFSGDADEQFFAGDLKNSDEIRAFAKRFRPLSKQLEAQDCSLIQQGMRVCALRVFSDDDHRFYDAIVEAVKHEEHAVEDGAEKCSCSFLLSWLHGPEAGTLTTARIEDLCPILSRAQIDPRLACFLEIAKWKHGITSACSSLFTEDLISNQDSPISLSKCKPLCVIQKSEKQMQIGSALLNDEDRNFGYECNEDVDLGGGNPSFTTHQQSQWNLVNVLSREDNIEDMSCLALEGGEGPRTHLIEEKASSQSVERNGHLCAGMERLVEDVSHRDLGWGDDTQKKDARYFVLVENLERDVCPSTIVDFIRQATSLEIEAFLFSSLSIEPYAKGALVVNSFEKLEQLCNFVAKPDQIITSLRGRNYPDVILMLLCFPEPCIVTRPWIVSDSSAPELARTSFWCLEPDLEIKREDSGGDGLQVVKVGSEEYSKAEKLRDLFLEFAKHQEILLKRLAVEEQNILDS